MTSRPAAPGDRAGPPVLVTGGSGHVGANLVRRLLADGVRVRVLLLRDSPNEALEGLDVERAYADIRDLAATRRAVEGCQGVYHCAARVSTIDGDRAHRRELFECNVIGTRNVLQAAREADAGRVVVTGSFSAVGYDLDDPSTPSDETMQFYPMARTMPYERSKVLVEHECLRAVAKGQEVVVATSCAVVGGADFVPSRLGRTLCDFANGKLHAYVDGGFEFVAARDLVQGHVLCMHNGTPRREVHLRQRVQDHLRHPRSLRGGHRGSQAAPGDPEFRDVRVLGSGQLLPQPLPPAFPATLHARRHPPAEAAAAREHGQGAQGTRISADGHPGGGARGLRVPLPARRDRQSQREAPERGAGGTGRRVWRPPRRPPWREGAA